MDTVEAASCRRRARGREDYRAAVIHGQADRGAESGSDPDMGGGASAVLSSLWFSGPDVVRGSQYMCCRSEHIVRGSQWTGCRTGFSVIRCRAWFSVNRDVVRGSQGTGCRMWFSVNWMSCVILRGPDVEEENGS